MTLNSYRFFLLFAFFCMLFVALKLFLQIPDQTINSQMKLG